MATIWFLKEGEIQSDPPIEEKSLDWCIKISVFDQTTGWRIFRRRTYQSVKRVKLAWDHIVAFALCLSRSIRMI